MVQKEIINNHINVSRFIDNLALETKILAYKSGVNLSEFDLNASLNILKQGIKNYTGLGKPGVPV